ncbi:MAG TPA: ECF transporter S component [Clostridia bacterium]|nr:ECF transporter S component [Clostridia bacterium]
MLNVKKRTTYITKVGILSALSFLIMFALEFPIPFMPPFLKIDFSEIPAMLAAFALGPIAAVIVELIKNLIHLTISSTTGIGELSNFLVGIAYLVPAGVIYKRIKSKKGAVISLIVGSISMAFFAAVLNYLLFIPLYGIVLNFPVNAVVGMGTEVNSLIVDLKTLIVFGIVPFNLIKSIIISALVLIMYKRLSPILHYQRK